MTELTCIKCERKLSNIAGGEIWQPNDGMEFLSYGAYGTTVFDPCDGSTLRIIVCDPCVQEAIDKGFTKEVNPTFRKSEDVDWTYEALDL